MNKPTNALIGESSPYLLQHAYNPVNWFPWGPEALEKAKQENKLLLISIGYSACHWCHVMEHESFEDEAVAAIMNEHFVCVKVDREERPDIDQIYMQAVQLINGQGGWPLNCVALPDQRPIYGGTYFRKEDWKRVLLTLAEFYQHKTQEALTYADKLTAGLKTMQMIVPTALDTTFTKEELEKLLNVWKPYLDFTDGGNARAPKFPLPNNFQFLLRYNHFFPDQATEIAVKLTLEKMALGGIYDQLRGGFARYSVDGQWRVPHFEKMLYDNAQLISLYSEAYQAFKNPLYKSVIEECCAFVERELTHTEGGFFSALDADSEGKEGLFYTWTTAELKAVLSEEEYELASIYYSITTHGNWEEEQTNTLFRLYTDTELAAQLAIHVDVLQERIQTIRQKLFTIQEKRVRPGLDDKTLCSWNALMIKGLVDASNALNEPHYLEQAERAAAFLWENLRKENTLYHTWKNGKASIIGFLDDHAFFIDALLALFEATMNENWLNQAQKLADAAMEQFYDAESGLFFYTSRQAEALIVKSYETLDNVIPSANSAMARSLFRLGTIQGNIDLQEMATRMLSSQTQKMIGYGSAYSNWAQLYLDLVTPQYQLALGGKLPENPFSNWNQHFLPNLTRLGTKIPMESPKGLEQEQVLYYICSNGACQLPLSSFEQAVASIRQ